MTLTNLKTNNGCYSIALAILCIVMANPVSAESIIWGEVGLGGVPLGDEIAGTVGGSGSGGFAGSAGLAGSVGGNAGFGLIDRSVYGGDGGNGGKGGKAGNGGFGGKGGRGGWGGNGGDGGNGGFAVGVLGSSSATLVVSNGAVFSLGGLNGTGGALGTWGTAGLKGSLPSTATNGFNGDPGLSLCAECDGGAGGAGGNGASLGSPGATGGVGTINFTIIPGVISYKGGVGGSGGTGGSGGFGASGASGTDGTPAIAGSDGAIGSLNSAGSFTGGTKILGAADIGQIGGDGGNGAAGGNGGHGGNGGNAGVPGGGGGGGGGGGAANVGVFFPGGDGGFGGAKGDHGNVGNGGMRGNPGVGGYGGAGGNGSFIIAGTLFNRGTIILGRGSRVGGSGSIRMLAGALSPPPRFVNDGGTLVYNDNGMLDLDLGILENTSGSSLTLKKNQVKDASVLNQVGSVVGNSGTIEIDSTVFTFIDTVFGTGTWTGTGIYPNAFFDATVRPGSLQSGGDAGTMTLQVAAEIGGPLEIDLVANMDNDLVVVDGALLGLRDAIDVKLSGAYIPNYGDTFEILNAINGGSFDYISLAGFSLNLPTLPAPLRFSVAQSASGITLTVVPEPSSFALMAGMLGTVGLLARPRRKNQAGHH